MMINPHVPMFEFTKNGNFKSVFLEIITVPYKAIWFLLVDSSEYLALRPQNRAIQPSPGADGHGNNARGQPTHATRQGETSIVRHRSWCRITALDWGTSGWEIHKIPDENWEKLPNFFRIWPKNAKKSQKICMNHVCFTKFHGSFHIFCMEIHRGYLVCPPQVDPGILAERDGMMGWDDFPNLFGKW